MNIIALLKKKIELIIANSSQSRRIAYIRKCGVKVGDNTTILSSVTCFGSEPYLVEIGNNCLISSGAMFVTHDGGISVLNNLSLYDKKMDKMRPVKVGNNCYIGMRAIVMPGVTIGNNCIVGAGSIVTKDVPDGVCVAGVPAKQICTIYEYAAKNRSYLYPTCGMESREKREYLLAHMCQKTNSK